MVRMGWSLSFYLLLRNIIYTSCFQVTGIHVHKFSSLPFDWNWFAWAPQKYFKMPEGFLWLEPYRANHLGWITQVIYDSDPSKMSLPILILQNTVAGIRWYCRHWWVLIPLKLFSIHDSDAILKIRWKNWMVSSENSDVPGKQILYRPLHQLASKLPSAVKLDRILVRIDESHHRWMSRIKLWMGQTERNGLENETQRIKLACTDIELAKTHIQL